MRRKEIDYILLKMLESKKSLSDLNFTPGKPIQVESDGELIPVRMEPNFANLSAFQTEIIALNLINNNRELTETLIKRGSCDFSHQLKDGVRFRVNVFSRSGKYSIAMRKLETSIPTIKELNLPEVFYKMAEEKNGLNSSLLKHFSYASSAPTHFFLRSSIIESSISCIPYILPVWIIEGI